MSDDTGADAQPASDVSDLSLGEPQELAPGVFVVVAQPTAVTIGIVTGRDGTAVIDTGSAPAQGAEIRRLAQRLTGRPVVAAVVTHSHDDHAFGLAAFADVPTLGHESLTETVAGSPDAAASASRFGFDPAELVGPNRPLVVAGIVELGDRRVEVVHLGGGHTRGDVLVVVPDAGLVFAGDLIESAPASDGAPWYGPDSVPEEWSTTLDGLIGLMTDDIRAVPGHGDPVDRQFVFAQRGQVAAVANELARLAAEGGTREEALNADRWPFPPAHVEAAVDAVLARTDGPDRGPRRTLPLVQP